MTALKKPIVIKADNTKLEAETKKFNKRALIGSFIIHVFILFLKVPELQMEHKLKEEPKLIPIEMVSLTPPSKSKIIDKKLAVDKPEATPVVKPEEKVNAGTAQVVKNSTALGDPNQKKVQDVQKGDPMSNKREAYKPGTDLRKLPKTDVGTGPAAGKIKSNNGNTGGSGDTYKGTDLTNLTNSILAKGSGLKRLKKNPNAQDDGGAGGGTGGGMGDGVGGGSGNGHFTGTTTGTTNPSKIATNIGSLTGSAKGRIDSSKGFAGLAEKGEITVAGVPIERINVPTIDRDAVKRLLREHVPQFRYCYQTELDKKKQDNNLQGRVVFNFSIGKGGKVFNSEIAFAEITNDRVRDCIKNVLSGIQFPEPKNGASVQVSQPMNFALERL